MKLTAATQTIYTNLWNPNLSNVFVHTYIWWNEIALLSENIDSVRVSYIYIYISMCCFLCYRSHVFFFVNGIKTFKTKRIRWFRWKTTTWTANVIQCCQKEKPPEINPQIDNLFTSWIFPPHFIQKVPNIVNLLCKNVETIY